MTKYITASCQLLLGITSELICRCPLNQEVSNMLNMPATSNKNVLLNKHFKLLVDKYCDRKWSGSKFKADGSVWKVR